CTLTNTRKGNNVTIVKAWAGDATDGSSTTITTTGTAADLNNAVTAGTAFSETVSASVGNTITFGETALANYDSTYACSGGVTITQTEGVGSSFTMPDESVTCTLTNTRKGNNVTIVKAWAGDATDGSSTTITTTGTAADLNNAVTAGTAFSETVSASVGNTITFGETALANYDSTYACSGGVTITQTEGVGSSFTMPDESVT
ncbi:hypothetical protein, partial [uncultured Cocleimonas sp.]|uniref:hypothetical protein n=1 Tax=uncultured Cocleimonas sp. TaxID=1051587 RepID=UPI00260D2E98